MALKRNFTQEDDIFVGDRIAIPFEVFQDDLVVADVVDANGKTVQTYVSGTPEDVTGWTFSFAVRTTDTTTSGPVISKASGSGITITGTYNSVRASNTQRVIVAVTPSDTFAAGAVVVPPKTYRYSLKRTNSGSEKTIARGKFVLQEVPVRA